MRKLIGLVLALSIPLLISCTDYHDLDGKTALYRAAEQGRLQEVRELVEAEADLDSRNTYPDDTAFIVKLLPGTRHLIGRSPLHAASANQHIDVVKYLVVNGADVNAHDHRARTPLSLVAESHGNMEIVKLLVEGGADIDPVDTWGYTPLLRAAEQSHTELVRYLASKGALADRRTKAGETALHFTAENGNAEITSILLANGAQPNLTYENVQPALQLAVLNGHDQVVDELLAGGADPNQHAPGTTHLLVAAAYDGQLETVELLLDHGADVDYSSGGYTAAHHAAAKNYSEIISALLLCGADLEKTDEEGDRTPLQIAVEESYVDTVRQLLEGGADPNSEASSAPAPLLRAARLGSLEIVELLVVHGANVNVRDGEWTPLRFAEFGNHEAIVDFLRQHGGQ
jgi:ankyrin repeat protein